VGGFVSVDLQTILDVVQKTGTIGILLILMWGGYTQKWVFGWVFVQMREDRDRWRDLALRGTELGTRSVALAQAMTPQQKEP
jgi:hypothetical protein